MSIFTSLLLSTALLLRPDTDLRIYNPQSQPVDARIECATGTRVLHLAPGEVLDLGSDSLGDSPALDAALPLLVFEISNDGDRDWQTLVGSGAECATPPMAVPLFACRAGVATAYVQPVDGATYAWTAEGATIIEGSETSRVVLQLGDASVAKLTCLITTPECTATATGTIAVREPIVIQTFTVPPSANTPTPVTISWTYQAGREPAAQLLTGSAFPAPVSLAAEARSHTFTPQNGDARSVELRATYGRAVVLGPRKRRRAVSGGAVASECPSAIATAKIDVRGCSTGQAVLEAPEDVAAGATFEALVDIDDGQKVQWSVENGTIQSISPFQERANVVAGASGQVRVIARIERTPGCFAAAEASVPIILPVGQCSIAPTATLDLQSYDCDGAVVRATFTGKPPFAGRWSDGTPFRESRNFATHEFRFVGTYGLTEFRDSSCFGSVAGSPSVGRFKPAVTLAVASSSCGTGRLAATFEGVPPFSGEWSDGQPFTTSDTRLERTVPSGTWSIRNLTDGACKTLRGASAAVSVAASPTATLSKAGPICQFPQAELSTPVYIDVAGGQPPYIAEWTDGTTHSSTISHFARQIPVMTPPATKDFELKRVTANGCEATLDRRLTTLISRNEPEIDTTGPRKTCVGTNFTVSLRTLPSPGGTIDWEVLGDARIVSGQGTPQVTFTSDKVMWTYLSVGSTYQDGYCSKVPFDRYRYDWVAPEWISDIILHPTTIPKGGTANLIWKLHGNVKFQISTGSVRNLNLQREGCCSAKFVDTYGPGTVPITFTWTDPCTGEQSETHTLTITE